jgi:hypothetical protein
LVIGEVKALLLDDEVTLRKRSFLIFITKHLSERIPAPAQEGHHL